MNPPSNARGFTVLELLVAATVTLLLAGVMLSVSAGVLELWRRAQGGFTAATEAVVALDLLERDLQAALYRPDGNTWLAVSIGNDPATLVNRGWLTADAIRTKPAANESLRLLPEPDATGRRQLREARFGLPGFWLRFVAASAESATELGLPRAIAYQVARRPVRGSLSVSNPAAVRYTLYRSAISSQNTFNLGYNVLASSYASLGNNPGAQRAPSTMANPNSLDVLATNVIDFGVWLYVREANGGLRVVYPAHSGDLTHEAIGMATPPDTARMPELADIMLRVLSEEGAARIEAIETGRGSRPPEYASDAVWWWAVAEAHSRVFVRRIEIKGGGR